MGGSGWGAKEYLRIVGQSQEAFLGTLSIALKVCSEEEFTGDAPFSFRVVQVDIKGYVFCHREWGKGHWETPRSRYTGVDNHQGCPAECQAGDSITVS